MAYFKSENHRLFYCRQGSGDLMFVLPGNTASSAHLQGELDYFSQQYACVAVDFWGTGSSDRLAHWPLDWWEQAARDAAALIKHLGAGQAAVMGSSGGGIVALLLAAEFPQLVRAVIADSCVEKADFYEVVRGRTLDPLQILTQERHLGRALRRMAVIPVMASFWKKGHGADWRSVVAADSDFLLRLAHAGGDYFKGRLGKIQCPVLLTASRVDPLLNDVTAQLAAMQAQMRDCRVFLAEEGGHPLAWSRPDVFRREVNSFLA